MTNKINTHKLGLVVGAFVGGAHLLWSILVALDWAQVLIDWKLSMHFLDSIAYVTEFDLGTAVMLVALATAGGYLGGQILGRLWNWIAR